jgi:cyanophycin synthetase
VIVIQRIEVGERSLEATLSISEPAPVRTDGIPEVAPRLLEALPGLRRHSCENDDGRDLVSEMHGTETAHLVEHVACELMALSGSPRTLKGRTEWDFARDGRGVFRITLEFDDDLVALAAMDGAVGIVQWAVTGEGEGYRPDVGALVARLRAVRTVEG